MCPKKILTERCQQRRQENIFLYKKKVLGPSVKRNLGTCPNRNESLKKHERCMVEVKSNCILYIVNTKQTTLKHTLPPNPFRKVLKLLNHPAAWIVELILAEVFRLVDSDQEDHENQEPQKRRGAKCSREHALNLKRDALENILNKAVDVGNTMHAKDKDKLNQLKVKVKLNIENCMSHRIPVTPYLTDIRMNVSTVNRRDDNVPFDIRNHLVLSLTHCSNQQHVANLEILCIRNISRLMKPPCPDIDRYTFIENLKKIPYLPNTFVSILNSTSDIFENSFFFICPPNFHGLSRFHCSAQT